MPGVGYFAMTVGFAALLLALVRIFCGARGERALGRLADRATPGAAESRILANLGTAASAVAAGFETRRHRASWGGRPL
jgi:hypothetical protein